MGRTVTGNTMSDKPLKICKQCAESFEDDALNFPMYNKSRSRCLKCVTARKRAQKEKRQQYRAKVVAQTEEKILDTFCKEVKHKGGGSRIPHSAELLESAMTLIGGVDGLSALIVKQMLQAKEGGAIRNKCLELLTRLVTTNTELEGNAKNLELWQEEEIQAELDRKLKEAAMDFQLSEKDVTNRLEGVLNKDD